MLKSGDQVVCVNAAGSGMYLDKEAKYRVTDCDAAKEQIRIETVDGSWIPYWWATYRFELASSAAQQAVREDLEQFIKSHWEQHPQMRGDSNYFDNGARYILTCLAAELLGKTIIEHTTAELVEAHKNGDSCMTSNKDCVVEPLPAAFTAY
jgi:hypothetical protein